MIMHAADAGMRGGHAVQRVQPFVFLFRGEQIAAVSPESTSGTVSRELAQLQIMGFYIA